MDKATKAQFQKDMARGDAELAGKALPDVEGVSWVGGKIKLELQYPIEVEGQGENLKALSFRQMRGREFRTLPIGSIDKMDGDTILTLAGNLTGVADTVFDDMHAADCFNVMGVVSFFFGGSVES